MIFSPAIINWKAKFIRLKTVSLTSNDVKAWIKDKLSVVVSLYQIWRNLRKKRTPELYEDELLTYFIESSKVRAI